MSDADDPVMLSAKDLAGCSRYHTDEDCRNLPADVREWPEAKAERRGLTECRFCAETVERNDAEEGQRRSLRTLVNDDSVDLGVAE